jgi:hypothetical protein
LTRLDPAPAVRTACAQASATYWRGTSTSPRAAATRGCEREAPI